MVTDDGTSYAYDALNRLVQRGSTQLSYADMTNNPVAAGGQVFARTPDGTPLSSAAADGTGAVALSQNRHTDVTGGFDPATGALASSAAYSPFGKVTARQGTGTSLGYQGGWTDPESGKVNMHARWYDPALGTFASRDSWTLNPVPSVQANRYTYGNGTPLNGTDPTGHCFGLCVAAGIGAAAAAEAFGWSVFGTVVVLGTGAVVTEWQNNSGSSSSSGSYSTGLSGYHSATQQAIRAQAQAAARAAAMEAARQAAYQNYVNQSRGGNGGGGGGGGGAGTALRPGGGPGGPSTFGPPPPPPPPPWKEILRRVLRTEVARDVTQAVTDSLHKAFVADSLTTSRGELEVTEEELRGYFKLFPRAEGEEMAETLLGFAPEPNSDGGSGTSTNDNPCSKPRSARYNYQPLRGGCPDGATALICPHDLKPSGPNRDHRNGSVNTYGFPEGNNRDHRGNYIYDRTHILGDWFHGAQISENLFTGHQRMNRGGMARCENRIAEQLRNGRKVFYSGQLIWGSSRDTRPDIRMTAYTRKGLLFDEVVVNTTDRQRPCPRR